MGQVAKVANLCIGWNRLLLQHQQSRYLHALSQGAKGLQMTLCLFVSLPSLLIYFRKASIPEPKKN